MAKKIILASASPRRTELLSKAGIVHAIKVSDIDETPLNGESPARMVERLSRQKAEVVSKSLSKSGSYFVIAADTTVVDYENRNLGKPETEKEARAMIQALQGRRHFVFTGYTVLLIEKGMMKSRTSDVIRTDVYMKKLTPKEIAEYVKRGECMDKAGAYAAQGFGMVLIEKIVGSYTNVIGLPVAEVIHDLKKLGWKANERTRSCSK